MTDMDDEKILEYLNGKLSNEEKASLEKQVAEDEKLAKRVASFKEMKSFATTKISEIDALIAAQNIHKKYEQNFTENHQTTARNKSLFRYLIPISIAAIVVLGFFFTKYLPSSEQNLYAEYFETEDIGLINRSDDDQQLIIEAERQFNQKDFIGAETDFALLIDRHPTKEIYKLYHAISQLSNEKISQSRQTLEFLSRNELYRNESLYYLGLSYVKTQNNQEAIRLLSQINRQFRKYTLVQELIRKLK